MLVYLLKSGVCLAVFFLFYKLLLEKEPIHIFKRIYLLGGLLLAFAIPLITFTTTVEVEPIVFASSTYSAIDFEPQLILEAKTTPINYWPIVLLTVYGFGVVLFGLKFLFNLFQINTKIRRNTKQKVNQFTHVLLEHLSTPHTFFSYIFLNKQRYLQHQIPQEVFWHEETHAKQKHSFDVVFLEILQVVFWFNPLLYFIKKDIKLNHEFLADRAVLNKGVPLTAYQEILLAFSTNSKEPQLTNALNYSSIKKRFTIMKTKTSKKAVWIKSLILLPLIVVLVYSFSEKEIIEVIKPSYASENQNIINDEIKIFINQNKEVSINNKSIAFNAISTELIKISKETYTNKPKIFIEIEGHLSTPFLDELEKEVSKTNLSIYEIKSTSLTLNQNDEKIFFKGTKFTADSIVVNSKNSEKIVGISKPKKNQQDEVTLEEKAEYNKLVIAYNAIPREKMIVKEKDLDRVYLIYHKMTEAQKQKAETYPDWEFPPTPSNNTIQETTIPNKQLEKLVTEYNILKAKQIASKNSADSNNLTAQLKSLENRINEELEKATKSITEKYQDKATAAEITEYNKLARLYNGMSKENMVVKLKDVDRLKFIYNKMTQEQKNEAVSFPYFPPSPPSVKNSQEEIIEVPMKNPPPPPIPEDATPEEKERRLKVIQKYAKENPDKITKRKNKNGEIIEIVEMPVVEEETRVVQGYPIPPPPPPTLNQKTIEKGSKKLQEAFKEVSETAKIYGESVQKYRSTKKGLSNVENLYKKALELHKVYRELAIEEGFLPTPPPPPPTPPNPTDHMIEMAKQGTLFYYEDKKISSDKAIEITKKNKSINIQVLGNGSSKPVVKLSKKPIMVKE